ncbi:hypothetical protein [Cupriavidus sp. a3]|uniref:hypothetical protein n=1 Tax=Cupriavidus sp. a3 TaxID=3242158 RepID=UPI003D9C07B7
MARKKNYEVSAVRREQFHAGAAQKVTAPYIGNPGEACIDAKALLGPDARFVRGETNINLNDWLGRGIDAWVWAVVACLRSLFLSGSREPSTIFTYGSHIKQFFIFLTEGEKAPRVATPAALSPLHTEAFVNWLRLRGQQAGNRESSVRARRNGVKSMLLQMFKQGYIAGEPTRFFRRGALPVGNGESRQTSLSDAEQERVANAIKTDLVAIHHGHLELKPMDVQALRLLLVAHRQGHNPTPILELDRNSMFPGLFPGTIRMRTRKGRSKKVESKPGRAAPSAGSGDDDEEIFFGLAEGAVVQQAIRSTEALLERAPHRFRNRVWLYLSQSPAEKNAVTALTLVTLSYAIRALITRHDLRSDNGERLRLNLSRLRKSFFDRALRVTDGDLAKTANLMGNTPRVAGGNYPSMNEARRKEAAEFMNEEYLDPMRHDGVHGAAITPSPCVVQIMPVTLAPERTPVAGCQDTLNGEYAPQDGHNHCDRFVMCLFCSSFAIVGTVDELWRLFSFQAFARAELAYLDATRGPERTSDYALEDLRDRYRLAIPYIDNFTKRQFPPRIVSEARRMAQKRLHPFWEHQMTMSRRARASTPGADAAATASYISDAKEDNHAS